MASVSFSFQVFASWLNSIIASTEAPPTQTLKLYPDTLVTEAANPHVIYMLLEALWGKRFHKRCATTPARRKLPAAWGELRRAHRCPTLTTSLHPSSLSTSEDQASRLANLSIVLRLVKRTLQPYVKIRSSVQRDLLSFKPSTVLHLLWNMIAANHVRELCQQQQITDKIKVKELPQYTLDWAGDTLASQPAELRDLAVVQDLTDSWLTGKNQ